MSPRREVQMTDTMMIGGKLVPFTYTTTVFDHIAETTEGAYPPDDHTPAAMLSVVVPFSVPAKARYVPRKAVYVLAFVAAKATKAAEIVRRVRAAYRCSTEVGLSLIDGKPSDRKVKRAMARTARRCPTRLSRSPSVARIWDAVSKYEIANPAPRWVTS
jgi:hypothetical protein